MPRQSSHYAMLARMQAAAQQRQALEAQMHAQRNFGMQNEFAQRAAQEEAMRQQQLYEQMASGYQEQEAQMHAHREMAMAEREQQLKYEQAARETAAKQYADKLQYDAMNNQTNMMAGVQQALGQQYASLGQQGQQGMPGVNLFDSGGNRVGGSNFANSIKNSLMS